MEDEQELHRVVCAVEDEQELHRVVCAVEDEQELHRVVCCAKCTLRCPLDLRYTVESLYKGHSE